MLQSCQGTRDWYFWLRQDVRSASISLFLSSLCVITLGSRQISRKIQNELEQWRHHYKFPSAEVIKIGQKRAQTLRWNDFLPFSERLPLFHALKPWESLHNSSPGTCRRFNSTCWGLPVREHNCLVLNTRASHSTYAMQSTSTYLRPKAECCFLTSLNINHDEKLNQKML